LTPPARHYLDFERPIAELEGKIEELSRIAERSRSVAIGAELHALRDRAEVLRTDLYAQLDPWRKTQVARHPERPHFRDYVGGLIEDWVELRGDRKFGDDQAVVGGLGRFRGRRCWSWAMRRAPTPPRACATTSAWRGPEGLSQGRPADGLAEQFSLPVISLVDTAGAYPGIGAEERGPGRGHRALHRARADAETPFVPW
jgi:acetyl-CoA carboxylase carboxyl transferase subunit alpha